ncbi:MAG: LamG-like jellyroll fold domain-containing protein [Planctomycetota bacterium]
MRSSVHRVLAIALVLATCSAVSAQVTNKALKVDGENGYLRVPRDASLEPADQLTIEAWVKGSGAVSHGRIIRKEDGAGYHLSWAYQTNRLSGLIRCGGIETAYDSLPNWHYLDEWHHMAMTARRGGEIRLYIDGVLVGTAPAPGCLGHNGNLTIGDRDGGGEGFIGEIEEVRFWNVERTAEQIATNWRLPLRSGEGLVSVWPLDGDGRDVVGSNDGAVSGSVEWVESDSPLSFRTAPNRGGWDGGDIVTLTGYFDIFTSTPSVFFGTVPSPSVLKQDDFTLIVEVPPAVQPGRYVDIVIRGDGSELLGQTAYLLTPRLLAPTTVEAGSVLPMGLLIEPPTSVLVFFGAPPEIDLPFRQYGWKFQAFPLVGVFSGTFPFQTDVAFQIPVPDSPALVGKTILGQALVGPSFNGKDASFTNLVHFTIE